MFTLHNDNRCIEISSSEDVTNAVEKWLETNSFQTVMKDKGIEKDRLDQSFNNKIIVAIDVRDLEIFTYHSEANSWSQDYMFHIVLAESRYIDIDDNEILKNIGAPLQTCIIDEQVFEDEDLQKMIKNNDGSYTFSFDDMRDYMTVTEYIEKFISRDTYNEEKEAYIDYMLEDVGDDWEEKIEEFYDDVKEKMNNKV